MASPLEVRARSNRFPPSLFVMMMMMMNACPVRLCDLISFVLTHLGEMSFDVPRRLKST
jgi:hypothetical protein